MGLGSRLRGSGAAIAIVTILAGCSHQDNGLTKADYRDVETRTPPASAMEKSKAEPPIPELQPILAAPPPPELQQRLVSVNVPDSNVPVRDVLIELARKVGVDLDLDPKVQGGVIIYAKDRPFSEVIDRICDMANLRYTFKNNVLRVELDTMYIQNYHLDLPNITRKTAMDVSTSTDVFSAVAGGSGGGANNSSSKVSSESTIDPWKEIDDNLKQILTNSAPAAQPIESNVVGSDTTQTASMPAAPASTPKPAMTPAPAAGGGVAVPAPPAGGGSPQVQPGTMSAPPATSNMAIPATLNGQMTANQAADGGNGTGAGAGTATGTTGATNPLAQAQQNLINQATGGTGLGTAGGAGAGAAGAAGASAAPAPAAAGTPVNVASYYSINKSAGIVTVFGTAKQQKLARGYIEKVMAEATSEVLIEAKVVEVDLNDQFKSGIDWQQLGSTKGLGALAVGTSTGTGAGFLADQSNFAKQTLNAATTNPFSFSITGNNFNAAIQFVQGFGTTRTLSSPRITVMNNHTAVLKVAQNQVYFSLTATITPSTTVGIAPTSTYSSQLHTVPIGVVMTVQPVIDLERDQVTMTLRPSVSVHASDVSDPAVALSLASACNGSTAGACSATNIANAVTNSNVPVVDVREMDSVVTSPSGDIIVMGGMMQSNTQKQDTGVPGASDLPLLGNLFKVQSHETDVTELVIFLRASIVHGSDTVDWADKDLYKRYTQDPRPLAF